MSENPAPAFTGGRNVAIKVPEHAFEATVAFYRDTLALAMVYDAVGTKAFEFGPIRLWIDRMPHLAQGEMWLELVASDTAAAAEHLEAAGVVRCNEVEKLPPDLDGFWILNPAGIVHLVCSPGGRGVADGGAPPAPWSGVGRGSAGRLAAAARAQAGQLDRGAVDLEGAPLDARASAAPAPRRGSRRHRRNRGR